MIVHRTIFSSVTNENVETVAPADRPETLQLYTIHFLGCRAKVLYRVAATANKERSASSWSGQHRHEAPFSVYSPPPGVEPPPEAFTEQLVARFCGCCLPCLPWLAHGRVCVRLAVERARVPAAATCGAVVHVQVCFLLSFCSFWMLHRRAHSLDAILVCSSVA